MKTLLFLLLLTFTAHAQINYGPVDFTNKYGGRIQGQVLRVDAATFQVKQDGIISSIKFSDTPTNIQSRFNYDAGAEATNRLARAEREAEIGAQSRAQAFQAWLNEPEKLHPIDLVDYDYKVIERGNTYWKFSYKFGMANRTAKSSRKDVHIVFRDSEGFALDQATEFDVLAPAQDTNTIARVYLIKANLAQQVFKVDFNLQKSDTP